MSLSTHPLWRSTPLRLLTLGAAGLIGLVALGEITGWPFLRAPLAQQLAKITGSTVSLEGGFRVQLIVQPGIAVDQVALGSRAEMKVPHWLQAEKLVVRWRWIDLWRNSQGEPLRLKRLEADQIDAYLIRLANGSNSWSIGQSVSRNKEKSTELPQIETLLLRSGDIVYRDEPLKINLKAHIAQSADPGNALPWRATASGDYRGALVKLEAQAGADLPLLMQTNESTQLTPFRLNGKVGSTQINFDGATGALWAGQNLRGQFTVRGASLRTSGKPLGLTLPNTPPYRLQGLIARVGPIWSLVTHDATVGSSALTAAMQYDTSTTPPTLVGKLGGKRLAFADLAPVIGADKAPKEANRVLPDEPFDLPSLAQMNSNVVVDLAELDFGTPNIAPITALKLHLTLEKSRLTFSDLSARVAGGLLTGSTRLQANESPPRWEAALRFAEVDLERWIRSLKKKDAAVKNDVPAYLSGTLNAKVSLIGHGNSVASILGSGNGQLDLELVDGQMSQLVTEAVGLDAAQALGILIAGDVPLHLNCARASASIQDGIVKTRYAVLDNSDSTLHIQGGASLKTEALQLRVVADPKDFSPLSLRTPLNVTGNFKQPQVSVEAKGLVARVAGAILLGALAPPAALLAFIDTGEKADVKPCALTPSKAAKSP